VETQHQGEWENKLIEAGVFSGDVKLWKVDKMNFMAVLKELDLASPEYILETETEL
jgi:hypothetical protein